MREYLVTIEFTSRVDGHCHTHAATYLVDARTPTFATLKAAQRLGHYHGLDATLVGVRRCVETPKKGQSK